jgi:hypothetical protein
VKSFTWLGVVFVHVARAFLLGVRENLFPEQRVGILKIAINDASEVVRSTIHMINTFMPRRSTLLVQGEGGSMNASCLD